MEAAHQDPRRLRYAVNTHSDIDHMGGSASLRELLPEAVLICHVLDRPMVEDVERSIARRYGEFRADHGSDDPRT